MAQKYEKGIRLQEPSYQQQMAEEWAEPRRLSIYSCYDVAPLGRLLVERSRDDSVQYTWGVCSSSEAETIVHFIQLPTSTSLGVHSTSLGVHIELICSNK